MAHPENSMRVAEILSDLTSLRVCDPAAALALVSVRPSSKSTGAQDTKQIEEQDADLRRAKDLVELHYGVKERHRRGELGNGLEEARGAVERALGS